MLCRAWETPTSEAEQARPVQTAVPTGHTLGLPGNLGEQAPGTLASRPTEQKHPKPPHGELRATGWLRGFQTIASPQDGFADRPLA